jgi:hypothetical protein
VTYAEWIKANVEDDGYGKCAEVTLAMAAEFPELRRVRGHYFCSSWGMRSHWWLLAPDGSVIDPTAAQFPSRGVGIYFKWNEGDEEPTGKCANCGEYVYGVNSFCSDECARETERYLARPIASRAVRMTGVLR